MLPRGFARSDGHVPTDELLDRVSSRLKAMGNPLRLRILHALEARELSVGEILAAVETTQTTVSKHLAVLRAEGLVKARRNGMNVCYSIGDPLVLAVCRSVCDSILRQVRVDAEKLAFSTDGRRRLRSR